MSQCQTDVYKKGSVSELKLRCLKKDQWIQTKESPSSGNISRKEATCQNLQLWKHFLIICSCLM